MINALLKTSCTQSRLPFACTITKSKMQSTSKNSTASTVTLSSILRQTILPFGRETAQTRLREIVLNTLGKCVRVHEGYCRFVRRANIIYFRLYVSSCPFVFSPFRLFAFSPFRLFVCTVVLFLFAHILTHTVE